MAHLCDKLQAFHDGELPAAEADAFRAHLGGCERCEKGLLDLMMLGALASEAAAGQGAAKADARPEAPVISLEARRKRRIAYVAAPAVAAAAAIAVWIGVRGPGERPGGGGPPVVTVALADKRSFEARVSAPSFDRHRPYEVARSGDGGGEDIPLKTMAGFEEAGDHRALVGAYLLEKDDEQAEAALAKMAAGAERDSDRAAILLARGEPAEALAAADLALGARKDLGPALWNRALALRDLGLPLAAADAFDLVAAQKEPGWSDEAGARAAKLRGEARAGAASWQRLQQAKDALFTDGTPLPEELVAAHPAPVRLMFYNALRTVPSRERALALLPLAKGLDGRFGGTTLTDEVYRVAGADFTARAPLAAAFLPIAKLEVFPSVDEAAALHARIGKAPRAAGARDLALGVLLMTDLGDARPADVAAAAAAAGDAWFADVPAMRAAARLVAEGKVAAAERALGAALVSCKVEQRCMQLETAMGELQLGRHRPVAARPHYQKALEAARRLGDWDHETNVLMALGQAAHARGDAALAQALYREGHLRASMLENQAMRCFKQRWIGVLSTALAIDGLRFDEARRELAATPRCNDEWIDLQDLLVVADLARFGVAAELVAETRRDLARLRGAAAGQPGALALLDYIEGRLMVAEDAARARPILERAVAAAERAPAGDVHAQKARTYALSTLIVLDAGAGKHAEALAGFAREARLPAPTKCAVGLLFDDERVVVAARLADGKAAGAVLRRGGPVVDMTKLVPGAVIAGLRGCARVDVLAFAPIHGQPVLPPELPWAFVGVGAGGRAPAAAERRVIVADPIPPAELELPRLAEWPGAAPGSGVIRLTGAAATPTRVIEELRQATDVEIHAHGVVNSNEDTSMLVLSPEADGRYALSARDLGGVKLEGAPLVILAACETTETAPYLHERWSLPAAFVSAGARAVLASGVPIPDVEAAKFFNGLRSRLNRGIPVATALSEERTEWLEKDAQSWVRHVVAFEAVR